MTMVRNTRQRQAVLEVLQHSQSHPDAAWIYQEVRQQLPNISLATVYRTLDALVKDGIAMTIERTGQATRYDFRSEHPHQHALCRECGAIFDIDLPTVPALNAAALPEGFVVSTIHIEVHGTCQSCRAKSQN